MSRPASSFDLESEAAALVARLGGHWSDRGGLCRCPAHEDRSPSLSVRLGRSRILFHCFAGCGVSEILHVLIVRGLFQPAPACAAHLRRGGAVADLPSSVARRLWRAATPVGGTPAAAYLAARRLLALSPELRFHSRTPFGPAPRTRFAPAMIAAVRDERGLVAVHRTFLDLRRSRAGRARQRCALGRLGEGAVRLAIAQDELGLAEGIETALAATRLFGVPCWATLGTERFGKLALPSSVARLRLFLDNDAGGRRAEALAREAYPRLALEALYPFGEGADWNDVLRAAGGGADRF